MIFSKNNLKEFCCCHRHIPNPTLLTRDESPVYLLTTLIKPKIGGKATREIDKLEHENPLKRGRQNGFAVATHCNFCYVLCK
jgi:hypothetical protein